MQSKLTLRIDEKLIERAKSHARQSGKSVSQLVSDYLQTLPSAERIRPRALTPIVESLRGVLAGSGLDEEDYRRHLEENWSPGFFARLSAIDPGTAAAPMILRVTSAKVTGPTHLTVTFNDAPISESICGPFSMGRCSSRSSIPTS